MAEPRVSVVIPVYNGEPYIAESIESILRQTFEDFELIVVNDGSTDGTVAVVEAFDDSRIRLLNRTENRGIIFTRNEGTEAAAGDYIVILDSDDIADEQRIEKQVDFLENNPEYGMVGSWAEIIDENGRATGDCWRYATDHEQITSNMLFACCFIQSSVTLRRSALPSEIYREEYPPAEDFDLWVRMSNRSKVANLPEVLVKYRVHSASISRQKAEVQEGTAQKIIRDQLLRLGFAEDDIDMPCHRMIARPGRAGSQKDFPRVEEWLQGLINANKISKVHRPDVFAEVVGERWWRYCSRSSPLGLDAIREYLKSDLRKSFEVGLVALCKFAVRCVIR